MNIMNNLCIIPARGGSKRIPRKNIKDFHGKPIIAYTIEAALECNLFKEVVVSTDDFEIAEIAVKYGAKVPFMRSLENSNDYATTFDVINEVWLEYKKIGQNFDFTCCIYACAPFVTEKKLCDAFRILINSKFDSVFPIIPYSFPIQRALRLNANEVNFLYPEFSLSRSQDLEISYHDAGQYYWMNSNKCLEKKKLLTENSGGIVITELEGQDIDNEIDWKIAELKYELLQSIR